MFSCYYLCVFVHAHYLVFVFPSLILISAGFDAADGDENNYGMYDTAICAIPAFVFVACCFV